MLLFGKSCDYDDDVVATATAAVSAVAQSAPPGNGVRMRGCRRNAVSAACTEERPAGPASTKPKEPKERRDVAPGTSLMSAASKTAVDSLHQRGRTRTATICGGANRLGGQDDAEFDSEAHSRSWVLASNACLPLSMVSSIEVSCGVADLGDGTAHDTNFGHTPLIQSAMAGIVSEVQDLLSAKCNPDVQDEMGMTALMWTACSLYYPASWKQDHTGVAMLLLNGRASIDLEDNNGVTALMHALTSSADKSGLSGNALGNLGFASQRHGRSSLYWERACLVSGVADMIRLIIDSGADVDHCNKDGMTPLMLAAAIGSIGSMKILIEARANLHLQDPEALEV
eukprot:s1199_g13.t1